MAAALAAAALPPMVVLMARQLGQQATDVRSERCRLGFEAQA